jgi:Fic family protein
MQYLDARLAENIGRKLKELNTLRPLPAPAVKKIQEQFQIEMAYNSNAIEGNSLTLKETALVINEGITIKGKPLKDHLEARDHKAALDYLYALVGEKKRINITQPLILELHRLVVEETDKEWAGRYRNSRVYITGVTHRPPSAEFIARQMQALTKWFAASRKDLHAIELAALLHHKLVYIHPFFDGNGRSARLVMNVLLMSHGYPLAVILKNDRMKYYRALSAADKGEYKPLVRLIAMAVLRSLDIYLKTLTPASEERENFILLSEAAQGSSFSAKYLNLLIRQGRLEGHKEGRNWLTSKAALKRYIDKRQRRRV